MERVIRKIEDILGQPLTETSVQQQKNFMQEDNALQQQHVSDLASHSDACLSETEFLLGIQENDPHPDHQVIFDAKASDSSRLL